MLQKTQSDIKSNTWLIEVVPESWRPYAILMRLDRPIGTWLLLLPCWWSIALAIAGKGTLNAEALGLLLLFGAGAVVMRGAGCVVNDLWDRKHDRHVARTCNRPLAAGDVSVHQALVFLAALLLIGLAVLLQMNPLTILLGCLTIPLIATYPLMKRITWWPQLFLGLTFNAGALMGWSAVTGSLSLPPVLLYIAGIFWTLGYDTIYAYQDWEDDSTLGLRSTALRFGESGKRWVAGFYAFAWLCLLAAFVLAGAGTVPVILSGLPALHFIWQVWRWDMDNPDQSLAVFQSNRDLGFLVLLAAASASLMI